MLRAVCGQSRVRVDDALKAFNGMNECLGQCQHLPTHVGQKKKKRYCSRQSQRRISQNITSKKEVLGYNRLLIIFSI